MTLVQRTSTNSLPRKVAAVPSAGQRSRTAINNRGVSTTTTRPTKYGASSASTATQSSVTLRTASKSSKPLSRISRPDKPPVVERCPSCPYRKGRTCGPDGEPTARFVIIGEAPGREELSSNRPFIGKSGQLLNGALERAGIDRAEVYVTNALRCQPDESPPSLTAVEACRERLCEEVLAHPRTVILALGNSAARSFLGDANFKITGRRGRVIDLGEIGLFIATFHPASILRNQGEYPRWLEDIKYAGRLYAEGVAAMKRPPKPTAYVMLLEPEEGAYYPKVDKVKPYSAWVKDGQYLADWPTIKVVTGIPAAVRAVNMLLEMPELAADIETGYSYSPRLGTVLCLAVAWSPTESVVFSQGLLESKAFRPHLRKLLTDPRPLWLGHNWKFDSSFLRHQYMEGEWSDGAFTHFHDTMIEHYCLDETKGTHALEDLSRDFLGAENYKYVVRKYGKGDLGYENVPREALYPYCALDTTHTFALHAQTCPKVHESPGLTKLYDQFLLSVSIFLLKVQDYGLYVNAPVFDVVEADLSERIAEAEERLQEAVHREYDLYPLDNPKRGPVEWGPLWDTETYMKSKWATKKTPDDYNARNWRHTSFCLYRLIGWVPMNTNERTLRDLDQTGKDQSATFGYKAKNYARGHPNRKIQLNFPFIQSLIDVRLSKHMYSMLINGVRRFLEPDGRIHSIFNLHSTETGRLSSTSPNLQNLPVPEKDEVRHSRDIVGAPDGRVIMEADYGQVELRLLAHFSKDEALIEIYREGRDLHTELSIAIWGDRVFDENGVQIGGYTNYQRVRAKAVNFGIAYGRGAGSIAAEHDMPIEEAQEMRSAWLKRFPDAAKWLDVLHHSVLTGRTVISPFGRRRRFGAISRENYVGLSNEAANFPMQSTASDLTLYSAMRAQAYWDRVGIDAHVVCLVHDAVVVECPETEAEARRAELVSYMMDTPHRVLGTEIEFPVDVHTGKAWGTLKFEEMVLSTKATKTVGKAVFKRAGVASGKL